MAWTKKTIVDIVANFHPKEFSDLVASKAEEMAAEGKTDGMLVDFNARERQRIRQWRDEAAAQEWLDFLLSTAAEHNIEIAGHRIEDIVV